MKAKIKKRYIVIPAIIIVIAYIGFLLYTLFFKNYFADMESRSKLSEYEQTYGAEIEWYWEAERDSDCVISYQMRDSSAHLNIVPDDADQECFVERDDSPFVHRLTFYEYDYMNDSRSDRVLLAGEYRFVSDDKFELYVDDEYVGATTANESVLEFKKDVVFPVGIAFPTEEEFYKHKDYYMKKDG